MGFAAPKSGDMMSMPQELSKQQSQVSGAGQPQEFVAANAEKERRLSNMASPARCDRQRLIQAWKPTDEARPASRNAATSGLSPMAKGVKLFHMCPWTCFTSSVHPEGAVCSDTAKQTQWRPVLGNS